MKRWDECLTQESRAAVMQLCMIAGVSVIQVRSKTGHSIKVDSLRPEIVRHLDRSGHTREEIAEAMNRGLAWVNGILGPAKPDKWGVTMPKHVRQWTVKELKSGARRIEEV